MEKVDGPEHVHYCACMENVRSDVGGKFEGVLGRKMERRGKERGRKEGK